MKTNRLALAAVVLFGGIIANPAPAMTFFLNGGAPIIVPPTQSFILGRQIIEGVGDFTDLYQFTLGQQLTLSSGGFQSTSLGTDSNLDFISANLYAGFGTGGALVAPFTYSPPNADGQETESLGALLLNPGRYTIQLSGNVTADRPIYNGNMTFAAAAVPEPALWCMMVLGFGCIGSALRRQRSTAVFA